MRSKSFWFNREELELVANHCSSPAHLCKIQRDLLTTTPSPSPMPPQENSSDLAPYGYTATGRIRKKPTKQFLKAAVPPAPAVPPVPAAPTITTTLSVTKNIWQDRKNKFSNCPACYSSFIHRSDPHKAVWQHLLYFATIVKDKEHQEARDLLKTVRGYKEGPGRSTYTLLKE